MNLQCCYNVLTTLLPSENSLWAMKAINVSGISSCAQLESVSGLGIGQRLLRLGKIGFAMAVVLAGCAQSALASDPVGIYAIVTKVVFEPSESAPERIQIWGTFSVAEKSGQAYTTPEQGYLYFQLPKEKSEAAQREWKDLASLAGKNEAVGFAARYKEKGKVRKSTEKPAGPDIYPLGFGLTRIQTPPANHTALQRLFEAARKKAA
jgi:hypothetical protein